MVDLKEKREKNHDKKVNAIERVFGISPLVAGFLITATDLKGDYCDECDYEEFKLGKFLGFTIALGTMTNHGMPPITPNVLSVAVAIYFTESAFSATYSLSKLLGKPVGALKRKIEAKKEAKVSSKKLEKELDVVKEQNEVVSSKELENEKVTFAIKSLLEYEMLKKEEPKKVNDISRKEDLESSKDAYDSSKKVVVRARKMI